VSVAALPTVRVQPDRHGAWQVALPGEQGPIACPTLESARRLAHVTAKRSHPCELIVWDAYHRVLEYVVLSDEHELGPGRARITAR